MSTIVSKIEPQSHYIPIAERLRFYRSWIKSIPVQIAFFILRRALKSDDGYAMSWKANIAMAFYDEVKPQCTCDEFSSFVNGHVDSCPLLRCGVEANAAADRFMKKCFDVDTKGL